MSILFLIFIFFIFRYFTSLKAKYPLKSEKSFRLLEIYQKNFLNKEAEIGLLMIKKLPNDNKKGLLKNKSPFVHK